MLTIDTTNMCSHLQRKLFEEDGIYEAELDEAMIQRAQAMGANAIVGIDLGKLQPVIFDSAKNEYRVVGEKVGTAWGSGKTIQEREVK